MEQKVSVCIGYMIMTNVTAFIIKILHICLIIFVLFGIFFEDPFLLLLYLMTLITLRLHWFLNNDICFLTLVEKWTLGRSDNESFMHNLISPIYMIGDSQLAVISKWVVNILIVLTLFKFWKKGLT